MASARVELDGQRHSIIVTLREDANGTYHYDLSMDKGVEAETSGAAGRVTEARSGLADSLDAINIEISGDGINKPDERLFPAHARAVNAAAARELERVDIAHRVRTEAKPGASRAAGSYRRGIISILRPGGNWKHTLDHKIIHALRDGDLWGRDYGLFDSAEWKALARAARGNAAIKARVEAAYPDLDTSGQTEEMVAELYADWAQGSRETPAGPLLTAFERIRSFFRAVASALRGEGFHDASRIMERIANGEIGGRGRMAPAPAPAR